MMHSLNFQFLCEVSPKRVKHSLIGLINLRDVLKFLPISAVKKECIVLADSYHTHFCERMKHYKSEEWANQTKDISMSIHCLERYLLKESIEKSLWAQLDFENATKVEDWKTTNKMVI